MQSGGAMELRKELGNCTPRPDPGRGHRVGKRGVRVEQEVRSGNNNQPKVKTLQTVILNLRAQT
eukprot:6302920-Lingulodinium_polyedra.AAC.1